MFFPILNRYILPTALLMPALLLIASCEKNITVNVPGEPSLIVINSENSIGDTIKASISRSQNVKESQQQGSNNVNGAMVLLYVDGVVADTLITDMQQLPYGYISRTVATEGKTYRLAVSAPGFPTATSEVTAPSLVPLSLVSYRPNARTSPEGEQQDEVRLEWTDPTAAGDHYILSIPYYDPWQGAYYENSFYNWGNCINTTDVSVESPFTDDLGGSVCIPSNSIFLNDALFNGTKKQLQFFGPTQMLSPQMDTAGNSHNARVELYHVSEPMYKYVKAFLAARDVNGNPFSEPINVRGNVQNGYGNFSINTPSAVEIR